MVVAMCRFLRLLHSVHLFSSVSLFSVSMNIGISNSLAAIAATNANVLTLVSSWVSVGIFTRIIQFLDKSWTPKQPDRYFAVR